MHTPGPWTNQGRTVRSGQPGLLTLCVCEPYQSSTDGRHWHETTKPECEANARLMAAAPDLLESLSQLRNFCFDGFDGDPTERRLLEQAQSAIDKARGR